jgi:hypothetical protein
MPDLETLQEFLNGAGVDAAVSSLRPDHRAAAPTPHEEN